VSLDGGGSPAFSPTGRELFFLSPPDPDDKRRMMAVDVRLGSAFSAGKPRPLFALSRSSIHFYCLSCRCYAVSPDGQRFYVTQPVPTAPAPRVTQIHLVQNWTEELKDRLKGAK
jgi:hypothetical protein